MRRIGVGLAVVGVLVVAAVALSMAFADDDKTPDESGIGQIIAEPFEPRGDVSLDGDTIGGTLPAGEGLVPGPAGGLDPTEPIGKLPAPNPDAPVSSTPSRDTGGRPAPSQPTPGLQPLPAGSQRVLAPIDGADVRVLESSPPQYMLHVQAGLPSGCAKPAGYEMSRSGDTIRFSVYNSMPTGNPICTQIYGMYELNVSLGSDFESGKTYTVQVNDRRLTITAQ
jgi:hypothetical protein